MMNSDLYLLALPAIAAGIVGIAGVVGVKLIVRQSGKREAEKRERKAAFDVEVSQTLFNAPSGFMNPEQVYKGYYGGAMPTVEATASFTSQEEAIAGAVAMARAKDTVFLPMPRDLAGQFVMIIRNWDAKTKTKAKTKARARARARAKAKAREGAEAKS